LSGTGVVWAVFVFLLAKADREGFVDVHPSVISKLTGFSEEEVTASLLRLRSPDPNSRSQAQEGARLELIDEHRDWGWQIVNYERYRTMVDSDMVRAQTRERVRKHRESRKPVTETVTDGNAPKRHVEVEAEVDIEPTPPTPPSPNGSGESEFALSAFPKREPPAKKVRSRPPRGLDMPRTDKDWADAFTAHFWPVYSEFKPGCSRAAAWKAWCAIPHPEGEADFTALFLALEAYQEKAPSEPRFRKDASTWLNDYHRNLLLEAG